MKNFLKRLLMGPYARRAAPPRIVPFPDWTTGSGTEGDDPTLKKRRTLWNALEEVAPIPWLEGLKVFLFPGNELSRVLFLTGLYEPNEFLWLSQFLRPGMTVIDGGANMGLYTLYCARRVGASGRVLAVEPSAREFDRLERHVTLNRLDNVRLIKKALADAPGDGQLRIAAEWNAGHNTLGDFGYEETQQVAMETVPLTTIDSLVAEEDVTRVDFFKLDLEGAELSALHGARETLERFRPAILIEVSDRALCHQGASSAEILSFFKGVGYSINFCDGAGGLMEFAESGTALPENVIALP